MSARRRRKTDALPQRRESESSPRAGRQQAEAIDANRSGLIGPVVEGWNDFWFRPESVLPVARIRALLCLLSGAYLISSFPLGNGRLPESEMWYGPGGLNSTSQVTAFVQSAGLQDDARWYWSPLYLSDSLLIHQSFLVGGILVAALVAIGRGGRMAAFALWAVIVAVANRALYLGGIAETLLSFSLFAVAIAPPAGAWRRKFDGGGPASWSAGFARKLVAVQITTFAVATTATMLAGSYWWNGLAAYALAAPAADRTIDWTDTVLAQPAVHDLVTLLLLIALPLGILAAWQPAYSRVGRGVIVCWCVAVALLGSLWLYASVFAVASLAIRPATRRSDFDDVEHTV